MQTEHTASETCPICGSLNLHLFYPQALDYITHHHFQVWRCDTCRVTCTKLGEVELSCYYPSQYRQYNPFVVGVLKWFYRRKILHWVKDFSQPGYVLEIGCGSGFMLDVLHQQGWHVIGSERAVEALHYARHSLGLNVFVGEPEALARETFDLIILFQVLEHLSYPAQTLTQLSRLLKPDGKIIIGVPNFDSWQSRFGADRWFHLDVPRHLFHFSPDSICSALSAAGLTVEAVRYTSFEHDPYGWVQTILNRVDRLPNRLMRLLMRVDQPNAINLMQLLLAFPLGLLGVILAMLSWAFKRGAIMEVTAHNNPEQVTDVN